MQSFVSVRRLNNVDAANSVLQRVDDSECDLLILCVVAERCSTGVWWQQFSQVNLGKATLGWNAAIFFSFTYTQLDYSTLQRGQGNTQIRS